MNYYGLLIKNERLKRNWNQAGLCKGICSVSYLSKLERGQIDASKEVLYPLLERLELLIDDSLDEQASDLAEKAYEALFSGNQNAFLRIVKTENFCDKKFVPTSSWIDLTLLYQASIGAMVPIDVELEACMDTRQLAMQRLLQGNYKEAIKLIPNAYFYYRAGCASFEGGESCVEPLEYLQKSYEIASQNGQIFIMLNVKILMGNCYCSRLEIDNMEEQYEIALRIARSLNCTHEIKTIEYNIAAGRMEVEMYQEAYTYFSSLSSYDLLSLHKLAICCEKLHLKEEAINALDRADELTCDYPPTSLARKMCDLVRFRLNNENYLTYAQYGLMLEELFEECLQKLSISFASFHIPWLLEWYKASRQYKKALELVANFPLHLQFNSFKYFSKENFFQSTSFICE